MMVYFRLLGKMALETLCSTGHHGCLSEASERFSLWINNPKVYIHPDHRLLIYKYGMQESKNPQGDWDKMWRRYLNETNAQEKINLLHGLSYIQQPGRIRRYPLKR